MLVVLLALQEPAPLVQRDQLGKMVCRAPLGLQALLGLAQLGLRALKGLLVQQGQLEPAPLALQVRHLRPPAPLAQLDLGLLVRQDLLALQGRDYRHCPFQ